MGSEKLSTGAQHIKHYIDLGFSGGMFFYHIFFQLYEYHCIFFSQQLSGLVVGRSFGRLREPTPIDYNFPMNW